jgi:hypothetical protein
MSTERVFLDHLLTYVPSLEDAAALFRRMGFTVSPVSHIESMGISNHLVLMQAKGPGRANYIELMSPHDRSKLPPQMMRPLSGDGGVRSMVIATDDLPAFQRRLVCADFPINVAMRARREWKIPGEPSVYPEFDVMLPVEAPLPFNACRYYNLELYRRADWLLHANGARRVSSCYAIGERPEELSAYARIFDRAAYRLPDGGWCFPAGDVDLIVLPPAIAAARFGLTTLPGPGPAYLGYEIRVGTLDVLRAQLQTEQVPHTAFGDRLVVQPHTAFGSLIVFSQDE